MRGTSGLAVAAAGALVAGSLWWGTADLVSGRDPESRAGALVPADGTRTVSRADDGTTEVSEQARLTGPEMVLTSPPGVGGALVTLLDGDPEDWRIWRTTQTGYRLGADESPEQATTLRRLTDRGVEQLADYGPFTLVFDPPLLELPAGVRDGSHWSGSGDATTDGTIAYESGFTAEAADRDGCLRVTGEIRFSTGGEPLLTSETDETWCEGEGVVPTEAADPPAYDGETRPGSPRVTPAEVAGWRVSERPLVYAESVEGAAETGAVASATLDQAPAPLGDGVVVADATGDDVLGLAAVHGALVRAWVGHPGGEITGLGTSGSVTVAVTTRREAVAYGEHGQWLWSRRLPDVAVTDPLAVDEHHLVLTTTGGHVVVVDPGTGALRWEHRMTDQVRAAPVSDGETVVVGDVAGRVTAWDVDSGDERWSADPGQVLALGAADGVVVAMADGVARGYRGDDGRWLWSRTVRGAGGEAVVDLGSLVGLATTEEVVAVDAGHGDEEWRAAGADVALGLDGLLAQVDQHRLTVRDPGGTVLGRWRLPGLRGSDLVAASATGLWVADGSGRTVAVGP